jgi:hypothetical protein
MCCAVGVLIKVAIQQALEDVEVPDHPHDMLGGDLGFQQGVVARQGFAAANKAEHHLGSHLVLRPRRQPLVRGQGLVGVREVKRQLAAMEPIHADKQP